VAKEPPTPWGGMFYYVPDTDLRIQALSTLIHTDPDKSITLLKNIALEEDNTAAARRAVFVLAQSRMPKAQSAVVEVATNGAEPVQIAAVRELGRFGDPTVAGTLMKVYRTAKDPVKREVVFTLGRRSEVAALVRIVDSERDVELREAVVTSLGRAGGREPLTRLYFRDNGPLKQPIIASLFSCRGEDELIRIAQEEKNPRLKSEAIRRLTLMGTPKAKAYVEKTRATTKR
jgi:HEAT repeat protein